MNADQMPRPPRSEAIEALLLDEMHRDLTSRPFWKRNWVKWLAVPTMLVVAGGSLAAVAILQSRQVHTDTIVHCFAKPEIYADGSYPGTSSVVSDGDGYAPIEDAIGMCMQVWETGILDPDFDPLDPQQEPTGTSVPSTFTVCVRDDGSAAVVPGEIECSVLRMHPHAGSR